MQNTQSCWPDHLECDHRDYIGRAVTLNGEPATIVKDSEGRAYVAPMDTARGAVPYSWTAIWNTVDNRGGKFD